MNTQKTTEKTRKISSKLSIMSYQAITLINTGTSLSIYSAQFHNWTKEKKKKNTFLCPCNSSRIFIMIVPHQIRNCSKTITAIIIYYYVILSLSIWKNRKRRLPVWFLITPSTIIEKFYLPIM